MSNGNEHEPPPGYFRLFQGPDGSFVDMHETHGKLESRQNIPIALFLAARGEKVWLLPVLDLRNVKSPDTSRDGVEWEFKVPQGRGANAIDKALRDANRQAARVLIQVRWLRNLTFRCWTRPCTDGCVEPKTSWK